MVANRTVVQVIAAAAPPLLALLLVQSIKRENFTNCNWHRLALSVEILSVLLFFEEKETTAKFGQLAFVDSSANWIPTLVA